jgi:putative ABC transport system permease protein
MLLFQDIRLTFRQLRRAPALAAIALLSIALSVGATSVVFTAIKFVLLTPLPYARADELLQLGSENAHVDQVPSDLVLWNDVQEIRRRTHTLATVGSYGNALYDLAGDPPEALYGLRMSANLFPALGVAPMLGRNVLPEEDQSGHGNVMILSYGLWTRRFHSDRGIVGRTITINGHDCLVIGVMPPEFNFPLKRAAAHTPSPYVEFWAAPFTAAPNKQAGLGAVARLRPGVTLEQARQDLASIGVAVSREFPETNRDRGLHADLLRERAVGDARNGLFLLFAGALLFMLIGCANVANLLLARGFARQREIAIRMAIGAGQAQIIRQLLTESCVLAVLGGLGGYFLTAAAWKLLPALAPVSIPRLAAARADGTVLVFTLAIALINGLLFGITPALRAAGARPGEPGGAWGRTAGRHDRTRSSLVIAEVAVSLMLVVIGGQLLGSFVRLLGTDPGFDADRILASVLLASPERYRTPQQRGLFYQRALDAARALPGVTRAGTVDALPFSGEDHQGFVSTHEAAAELPSEIDVVSADYLPAMGVRLTEGRWFHVEEMRASSDAAIVNEFAAARLWPGSNPLGQRICVFCTPDHPQNWKQVIGVVATRAHATLDQRDEAAVYLSAGALESAQFLVVRTARPSADLASAIRRTIAGIDPRQTVFFSASMRDLIADSLADRRFIMLLLAVTGCLALAISAAGVYGVISYTTSRRTREIGIRIALGATPGKVQALIFRQGFRTVAFGLALGLAATVALSSALRHAVAGLASANPAHIWIAAGIVTLAAGIACWIPARRATRIDPLPALRQE